MKRRDFNKLALATPLLGLTPALNAETKVQVATNSLPIAKALGHEYKLVIKRFGHKNITNHFKDLEESIDDTGVHFAIEFFRHLAEEDGGWLAFCATGKVEPTEKIKQEWIAVVYHKDDILFPVSRKKEGWEFKKIAEIDEPWARDLIAWSDYIMECKNET
jgi:hypothetical protein